MFKLKMNYTFIKENYKRDSWRLQDKFKLKLKALISNECPHYSHDKMFSKPYCKEAIMNSKSSNIQPRSDSNDRLSFIFSQIISIHLFVFTFW